MTDDPWPHQDDEWLFHWSPRRNRDSITRLGLLPGQRSNDGDWNPPHICLAETPRLALSLCHGTPPLDLWMVHRTDCTDLFQVGQEWRTTHPIRTVNVHRVHTDAHEGNLL